MRNKIIIFFSIWIFLEQACFAANTNFSYVNWNNLGLSPLQRIKINASEAKWQRISCNLNFRIINNRNTLRFLLVNPYSKDEIIKKFQKKILTDQMILNYQAMEIFLKKRAILTMDQKKILHEMISR